MNARHSDPHGEFDFEQLAPLRSRLAAAMDGCADSMHEKAWLTVMLSTVLDALAPQVEYPAHPLRQQAFAFLTQVLGQGGNPALVADPEPAWFDGGLLKSLQRECRTWHEDPHAYSRHQVYARPVESRHESLATNPGLLQWCEEGLQTRLRPTGKVNFIHYFGDQQRCSVHADNPEHYEYNCLIGVLHECPEGVQKSMLRVFEADSVTDVRIDPGSAVIFHSSAIPHGRTPLAPGERISLMSVGFHCASGPGASPGSRTRPVDSSDERGIPGRSGRRTESRS